MASARLDPAYPSLPSSLLAVGATVLCRPLVVTAAASAPCRGIRCSRFWDAWQQEEPDFIPLNTSEGMVLLAEAFSRGAGSYANVAQHWSRQTDDCLSGAATGTTLLNAIAVPDLLPSDLLPGQVSERGEYITEEFFLGEGNNCTSQLFGGESVKSAGLNLTMLGLAMTCWGLRVEIVPAKDCSRIDFRHSANRALKQGHMLAVQFAREGVELGHTSPLASYSSTHDMFLILDVAKHRFPGVWVQTETLFEAMNASDHGGYVIVKVPSAEGAEPTPRHSTLQLFFVVFTASLAIFVGQIPVFRMLSLGEDHVKHREVNPMSRSATLRVIRASMAASKSQINDLHHDLGVSGREFRATLPANDAFINRLETIDSSAFASADQDSNSRRVTETGDQEGSDAEAPCGRELSYDMGSSLVLASWQDSEKRQPEPQARPQAQPRRRAEHEDVSHSSSLPAGKAEAHVATPGTRTTSERASPASRGTGASNRRSVEVAQSGQRRRFLEISAARTVRKDGLRPRPRNDPPDRASSGSPPKREQNAEEKRVSSSLFRGVAEAWQRIDGPSGRSSFASRTRGSASSRRRERAGSGSSSSSNDSHPEFNDL